MALLLLAAPRLFRREQTAAAADERMVSKAANDTTIRHIALAVGGVAAALAVMGGSLVLGAGGLGGEDRRPRPGARTPGRRAPAAHAATERGGWRRRWLRRGLRLLRRPAKRGANAGPGGQPVADRRGRTDPHSRRPDPRERERLAGIPGAARHPGEGERGGRGAGGGHRCGGGGGRHSDGADDRGQRERPPPHRLH